MGGGDTPTLPNGWRFLEVGEDVQDGDLIWGETGWQKADPAASPSKHIIIRKLSGVSNKSRPWLDPYVDDWDSEK